MASQLIDKAILTSILQDEDITPFFMKTYFVEDDHLKINVLNLNDDNRSEEVERVTLMGLEEEINLETAYVRDLLLQNNDSESGSELIKLCLQYVDSNNRTFDDVMLSYSSNILFKTLFDKCIQHLSDRFIIDGILREASTDVKIGFIYHLCKLYRSLHIYFPEFLSATISLTSMAQQLLPFIKEYKQQSDFQSYYLLKTMFTTPEQLQIFTILLKLPDEQYIDFLIKFIKQTVNVYEMKASIATLFFLILSHNLVDEKQFTILTPDSIGYFHSLQKKKLIDNETILILLLDCYRDRPHLFKEQLLDIVVSQSLTLLNNSNIIY